MTYTQAILGVSAGRAKFKVKPPSCEGPEEFQCRLRAQQNTLEFLVVILPLIWINAVLIPLYGAVVSLLGGLAWSYYRLSYIKGYAIAPEKRTAGFAGSLKALKFMLGGAAVGCLYQVAILVELLK
jgi:glutathione S-transferase